MSNSTRFLDDRFIAFSGIGMIQTDKDTPLADAVINTRHKCTIALEDNVSRRDIRDCEDVDLVDQKLLTRYKRLRLTYPQVEPQILALWTAYDLGQAAAPTGALQNEIQTLSRSGTVSGGTFTLALTLEGRTATTSPIAYDATATDIENALAAARMKWIMPGDVSVSGGTRQVERMTVVGTVGASGAGNIIVNVLTSAAVSTALYNSGAGKNVTVAVANNDTASQVATKIRAALDLDSDVAAVFQAAGGTGANVDLTTEIAIAPDATMNVSYANDTASGLTNVPSSTTTTPGVSSESWGGLGMVITFGERLAHADLAQLVVNNTNITGGGSILNTNVQNGSAYYHAFTRAQSREKVRFGFALGYLSDDAPDPVKYSGFVVESITPTVNRRQLVGFTVSIIGLFEGDTMTGYTIPDCVSVSGLESADCKVLINNVWETSDISTLSAPFNDNVPLDDSAYGFDGIDPDLLARAKQVTYSINAQIFATEEDSISILAENERTQAPVDAKFHFGLPGDRLTILAPSTKVKFASGERFTAVGAAERFAGNFELTAFKDDQDPPISAEAYLEQSVAFLLDVAP